MSIFRKDSAIAATHDFAYLAPNALYFDSACQTLRPQPVIDSLNAYFHEYNACGGRVKYEWGQKVDEQVEGARVAVLKLLGKSPRDYVCSFTLNTTYGLNLLLGQLAGEFTAVVTSDIEHNSVLLPTIALTKRLGVERKVLRRWPDGSLVYNPEEVHGAVVVVNATSNIDGRQLKKAKQLCKDAHQGGGVVILDGAQTMGHDRSVLEGVDFDAICFSGHKMYGPSLGVVVAKKSLLERLQVTFAGGGMVQDVTREDFVLTKGDLASRLEPGLQDWGGIIALKTAIDWLQKQPTDYIKKLSQQLYEGLSANPDVRLLNDQPSSIITFYSPKIDAHRLAIFLSQQSMMARSGYFCCHYYLQHVQQLPPLLRISLGLHNTPEQVDRLIKTIETIIRNSK